MGHKGLGASFPAKAQNPELSLAVKAEQCCHCLLQAQMSPSARRTLMSPTFTQTNPAQSELTLRQAVLSRGA